MATSDINGIIQYESEDILTPLESTLNVGFGTVSTAISGGAYIKRVANTTARNTYLADRVSAGRPASAADPVIVWRADATTGRNIEYTINGTTWQYYSSSADDTGWVNCTINGTGWTNVAVEPVQVRRIGNLVKMRGSMHNSTLAQGTTVTAGSVPVGFRPSQRVASNVSLNTTANLFTRIETNGNITAGFFSTAGTPTGSWYGFDNITYLLP